MKDKKKPERAKALVMGIWPKCQCSCGCDRAVREKGEVLCWYCLHKIPTQRREKKEGKKS